MEIKIINLDFSVCKVKDYSQVDFNCEYCFIGKTDEENSLVCTTESVPDNVIEYEDSWKAFRIQGFLDFSLIRIFAISTFNTDYILMKQENYKWALNIFSSTGYK